jgi:hypothetical protein
MKDGYFYITCIHRTDLEDKFTKEQIASLTDDDMEEIADKMADAYLESGYWESLEAATEDVLTNK